MVGVWVCGCLTRQTDGWVAMLAVEFKGGCAGE